VPHLPEIQDDVHFSEILATIRYGDTTGKWTNKGRFNQIDFFIRTLVKEEFLIHDVGCSTGVTSLELFDVINSTVKYFSLTISDRFYEIYAVEKGFFKYIFDSEGGLRQIYFGRILCDPNLSKMFPLSRFLFEFISKILSVPSLASEHLKSIMLMDPSIIKMINQKKIKLKQYNVFTGDGDRYHFIRCMNVLNLSYFSEADIISGINVLKDATLDGCYLQLGRTDSRGINRASIYQKRNKDLFIIQDFNGGAEIDYLINRS